MNKHNAINSVCTSLVREVTSDVNFEFEKKASVKTSVAITENFGKLNNGVNLKKIASKIKEALKPVEVSYSDLNSFIKDITNE